MPRTARASVGGAIHHALNRGNRRADVSHEPADADAFAETIGDARARPPLDILGDGLIPFQSFGFSRRRR